MFWRTYAKKCGVTAEIAEKIGEVLRQAGLLTNVRGTDEIKDLEPYHAVVLDSAVYVEKMAKKQ